MAEENGKGQKELSRRQFLKATGGVAAGLAAIQVAEGLGVKPTLAYRALSPVGQ